MADTSKFSDSEEHSKPLGPRMFKDFNDPHFERHRLCQKAKDWVFLGRGETPHFLVSHGSLGGQRPASAVQRESEREMVRP